MILLAKTFSHGLIFRTPRLMSPMTSLWPTTFKQPGVSGFVCQDTHVCGDELHYVDSFKVIKGLKCQHARILTRASPLSTLIKSPCNLTFRPSFLHNAPPNTRAIVSSINNGFSGRFCSSLVPVPRGPRAHESLGPAVQTRCHDRQHVLPHLLPF